VTARPSGSLLLRAGRVCRALGVLARGQVLTFAVLLCESIPIGCDSRCQTFNYLIPTMDSFIEAVANLSIIRGVAPNATLL
jgi:hypothetical protein